MATIGLCMIVKNEAHVITRCLDDVRPLIDFVLVEDTGSTDGTQQVIRDWLARENLPGLVIDEPWRDFAYNRTHALARLREVSGIDYAMIMDADDRIVFDADFDPAAFKAQLTVDGLWVLIEQDGVICRRILFCANDKPFSYLSVLHEYLIPPEECVNFGAAEKFSVISGRDGARSRNPRKYLDDALLLEKELEKENDPVLRERYVFYVGCSYKECGEYAKSLEYYLRRAEMGGDADELYYSLYQAGRMYDSVDAPAEQVLAAFQRAADAAPGRAEAYYGAASYCIRHKRHAEAYLYARRAIGLTIPVTVCLVDAFIYDYANLDALAVSAFFTGRFAECEAACDRLLAEGKLPASDRERVRTNRAHAIALQDKAEALAPAVLGGYARLLIAARAKEDLRLDAAAVLAAYCEAAAADPARAEALHGAARCCRNSGRYEEGYQLALRGLAVARPPEVPAAEAWIYDYGLLDELMANAFWAGRHAESAQACDRLLGEELMPADMHERIVRNRQALAKILARPAGEAAPAGADPRAPPQARHGPNP